MSRKGTLSNAISLTLLAMLLLAIVCPLVAMFCLIKPSDIAKIVSGRAFKKAATQSMLASSAATAITVMIGYLLAWCTVRVRIRCAGLFAALFTLPMLIPSISHGMGIIILFGNNGVLHNLLHLSGSIYGFWGIVVGSVLYSLPVAYLMFADVLRFEDSTPYEAAYVLGIKRKNQFTAITFSYLRKPLITIVFSVFTMIVTDYGVPLMVGGKYKTLPIVMYEDVIGLLDFGKGAVIGLILLLPAMVTFILDVANQNIENTTFVIIPIHPLQDKRTIRFAYVVCIILSMVIVLPIFIFCILAFIDKYPTSIVFSLSNIQQAVGMRAIKYFSNSLLIATLVSIVGVSVTVTAAYLTARVKTVVTRCLHLISIITLAIPGIVLGLAYILFFKGSVLYGTLAIMILVNTIHFFSSPYLMIFNAFSKLNGNLEAVGITLGVSRWSIVWNVLLDQARFTIFEIVVYFFVNSMMTISAVAFLANVSTKPISLMITQFEAQMMLECAAFVSLLILSTNIVIKSIAFCVRRKIQKAEV
jgi:iron(III) transport system permease protein